MWSYSRAVAAFDALKLSEKNLRLACYWLSLWHDDKPPVRSDFDPARVADILPGIALVELRDDTVPICRLAGTAIDHGLGRPISGTNLLDYLPDDAKAVRSSRARSIVEGAVSVSRTTFTLRGGAEGFVETLQLPFHGRSENGSKQYLAHLNWRPSMGRAVTSKPGLALGLPETFTLLPIG